MIVAVSDEHTASSRYSSSVTVSGKSTSNVAICGRVASIGAARFRVGVAGFAATHLFWLASLCLFGAGFAMVVTGVSGQTLLQGAVDPAMRGRVMSLYGIIFRGGPALGALVMGLFSADVGLQAPVIGAAVLTACYWAWAKLRQRRLAAALEVAP